MRAAPRNFRQACGIIVFFFYYFSKNDHSEARDIEDGEVMMREGRDRTGGFRENRIYLSLFEPGYIWETEAA